MSVVDSEDAGLRKALINARTGLSPTRRRTRSIRAVRSKDPNEATTHYRSRAAGLSSGDPAPAPVRGQTRAVLGGMHRTGPEASVHAARTGRKARQASGRWRRFAEASRSDGGNAFEAGRVWGCARLAALSLVGSWLRGSRGLIASRSRGRAAALMARWSRFPACRATGRQLDNEVTTWSTVVRSWLVG